MKASALGRWLALGLSALLLGGCYTVLTAPLTGPELQSKALESKALETDRADQREAVPLLNRSEEADRWDDGYGYSRYSGYGGYGGSGWYGNPGFFYGDDSPYIYNPYFGYGYGYPYGYGYGPYSYGYDPYYQGYNGYYIPPGYALVTASDLAQLRTGSQSLSDSAKAAGVVSEAAQKALRETQIRKETEAWERRDPRSRQAPETTTSTTSTPVVQPPPPPPAKSAPSQPADKGSTPPKKTRR